MTDLSTFDDLFGADEDRNTDGVWIQIGFNRSNEPIKIRVAEAGNPKHLEATRKYERAMESCRHDRDKRRIINAKIVAESILIDWVEIIDKKGKPVEASKESKIEALMHSRQFFGEVLEAAQDRSNFTVLMNDLTEETEGNSKAS